MTTLSDFHSSMGSKQREAMVRRYFTDEHGRRFFCWADKNNQRPIGEFVLADLTGSFRRPPWIPAMGQIDWLNEDSLEFKWRYASLAEEWAGYTSEWYSQAQQLAHVIPNVTIPEVGGDVHPILIGIMGPPPMSPEIPLACEAGEPWILGRINAPHNAYLQKLVHIGRAITSTMALETIRARVQAMIAAQSAGEVVEDLVGLPTLEIDALSDPSQLSYKDFMADAKRNGIPYAEAATAWNAHKANLASDAEHDTLVSV